jgi:hypothetical protein
MTVLPMLASQPPPLAVASVVPVTGSTASSTPPPQAGTDTDTGTGIGYDTYQIRGYAIS